VSGSSPFSPAPPPHQNHSHHLDGRGNRCSTNTLKQQQHANTYTQVVYYGQEVTHCKTSQTRGGDVCVCACVPWESSGGFDRALASSTSPLIDALRFLSETHNNKKRIFKTWTPGGYRCAAMSGWNSPTHHRPVRRPWPGRTARRGRGGGGGRPPSVSGSARRAWTGTAAPGERPAGPGGEGAVTKP